MVGAVARMNLVALNLSGVSFNTINGRYCYNPAVELLNKEVIEMGFQYRER